MMTTKIKKTEKAANDRTEAAKKDYRKNMEEIAPFTKKKTLKVEDYSTTGRWVASEASCSAESN